MTKFIKNFLTDQSGAAAAEYVLILAVIGGGLVVGASFLGTSISNALNDADSYIAAHELTEEAAP